ncbi:reverse transcriptase domain-containing protein [Tanacetum coccineum]
MKKSPNTPVVARHSTRPGSWTLFMDGSSCVDGPGAGLILTSPEGTKFTYALRFQFTASNNDAEYKALIAGLRIAAQMGVQNVQVNVDSKLVANQVLGTYVAKEENMIKYLEKVKGLVTIVVEEDGPTWMTPIMEYLKDGTLPDDRKEASKLRIKARQYELMEGTLYRRSFLKLWLRCVGSLQASYMIREIHEGSCSMHAGPRSVVTKAMRDRILLAYYAPGRQRYDTRMQRLSSTSPYTKKSAATANPNHGSVAVLQMGVLVDIAGPFPEGPDLLEGATEVWGKGSRDFWCEGTGLARRILCPLGLTATMIKSSHGTPPFSLTTVRKSSYPAEIECQFRTTTVGTVHSDEELRLIGFTGRKARSAQQSAEAKAK